MNRALLLGIPLAAALGLALYYFFNGSLDSEHTAGIFVFIVIAVIVARIAPAVAGKRKGG